jgi:hypothetical protein
MPQWIYEGQGNEKLLVASSGMLEHKSPRCRRLDVAKAVGSWKGRCSLRELFLWALVLLHLLGVSAY